MTRRTFVAAVLAIGAALTSCRPAAPPDGDGLAAALPPHPGVNVVAVSFDALRADALGIHGYARPTSPRIDAFAREAVVFERAYSAAPVTLTSFAAAFSGCLPIHLANAWQLPFPIMIAEAFAAAGYRTAAFFHSPQLVKQRSFDRGFRDWDQVVADSDEALLGRAIAWLDAHRDERHFVWIHLLTPHAPYRRRDAAAAFYDPAYAGPFAEVAPPRFVATTRADISQVRALYDGEVLHADGLFATLVDALHASGALDRTVLALTSDHGEEFGEHGGFGHGRLHEEHLHIPLVIRHPGAAHGSRSARLVSNVDLAPTLAALAAVPWPSGACDGRNVAAAPPRTEVVSLAVVGPGLRAASLRRDRERLTVTCAPDRSTALYDLATDPRGTRNVAAERDGTRRDLETTLWSMLGLGDCEALVASSPDAGEDTHQLDPRTIEALRGLGYVDP